MGKLERICKRLNELAAWEIDYNSIMAGAKKRQPQNASPPSNPPAGAGGRPSQAQMNTARDVLRSRLPSGSSGDIAKTATTELLTKKLSQPSNQQKFGGLKGSGSQSGSGYVSPAKKALQTGLANLPNPGPNTPKNSPSTGNSGISSNRQNFKGLKGNSTQSGGDLPNSSSKDSYRTTVRTSTTPAPRNTNKQESPTQVNDKMFNFKGLKGSGTQSGGQTTPKAQPTVAGRPETPKPTGLPAARNMSNPPTPRPRPANAPSAPKTNPANPASGTRFGDAFANARKAGLKTFTWTDPRTGKAKLYTTKVRGE